MSSKPDPFDPAEFAALWNRVAPEGASCPVVPADPPVKPDGDPVRLSGSIRLELCRWKRFQALVGWGVPCQELASGAYRRARRLSAALFLLTGGRYFPACSLSLPPRGNAAACLRLLYGGSERMELRYRQAAGATENPRLRALYQELGRGHRREQEAICALLERQ